MDRRVLIALFMTVIALQVYFYWRSPAAEPASQPSTPEVVKVEVAPVIPLPSDLPVRKLPLQFCNVRADYTTDGGFFQSVLLTDRYADLHATPFWSWAWHRVRGTGEGSWVPYRTDAGPVELVSATGQFLGAGVGSFDSPSVRAAIVEEGSDRIVARSLTPEGIEITQSIHVRTTSSPESQAQDCLLDVEVSWKNQGTNVYNGRLWLSAVDHILFAENKYSSLFRPIGMSDGSVSRWSDPADLDELKPVAGQVAWFGLADHYFASFVLASPDGKGTLVYGPRDHLTSDIDHKGVFYSIEDTLDPGEVTTERFRWYAGEQSLSRLGEIDSSLKEAVDLGIFAIFGRPLLWLLTLFHGWFGSWGLAIVALTFVVKTVFFPLTQRAYASGQSMQAISPMLKEVREKYSDSPEELNRRTMELFRENGVNPVGGCLPMLVQMPIWIALYSALQTSVDLYQSEFLYLRDLTSVDPYGILPLIVVILMFVQQKLTPMGNMEPAQQRMMQFMPLFIGLLFFGSPSGLVLYIFVNTLLGIAQQWLVKRTYKPAAVAI